MLSFVCERERVKLLGLSAHRPEEFLGFPFLLRLGLKPVCECVCIVHNNSWVVHQKQRCFVVFNLHRFIKINSNLINRLPAL